MLNLESSRHKTIAGMRQTLLCDPNKAVAGSCFYFWNDDRFICLRDLTDASSDNAGLAFPHGSEFEGLLRYCMLASNVYIDFWDNKWINTRHPFGKFSNPKVEEANALGYSTLLLPALIVAVGILLAPVLLAGKNFISILSRILKNEKGNEIEMRS